MLVPDANKWIFVTKMAKLVTKIRYQHRCHRFYIKNGLYSANFEFSELKADHFFKYKGLWGGSRLGFRKVQGFLAPRQKFLASFRLLWIKKSSVTYVLLFEKQHGGLSHLFCQLLFWNLFHICHKPDPNRSTDGQYIGVIWKIVLYMGFTELYGRTVHFGLY